MVPVLLKAGANPNQMITEDSILLYAISLYENHHDASVVKQLLNAGANPNFRCRGDYVDPTEDDFPRNANAGQSGRRPSPRPS